MPPAIEQRMRADRLKGGNIAFRLVAFLTAVPVHSELSASNTPSHKTRLLEPVWNGYVPSGIPEGMVVYHWKKLPDPLKPITDFSAFVKLRTRRTSRKILWTYLGIAFAIGLLGNWTAELVSDGFKSVREQSAVEQHRRASPMPERRVLALPPPALLSPTPSAPPSPSVAPPKQLAPSAAAPASGKPTDAIGNAL